MPLATTTAVDDLFPGLEGRQRFTHQTNHYLDHLDPSLPL